MSFTKKPFFCSLDQFIEICIIPTVSVSLSLCLSLCLSVSLSQIKYIVPFEDRSHCVFSWYKKAFSVGITILTRWLRRIIRRISEAFAKSCVTNGGFFGSIVESELQHFGALSWSWSCNLFMTFRAGGVFLNQFIWLPFGLYKK